MRVVAAGLLVVLVVAANQTSLGTAPQTPSQAQPAPRFKAGVDLVVVDVSVLDRDRRPVRGLAASDFTLLEDGRPQRIQTFSAVDMPDIVEPRAPWMREVAPDVRKNEDDAGSRIILIVLDDAAAIGAKAIPNVKEAASAIIDNLEPGDLAAVVFTSDRRGGQEFTYDRVRLRAAVNKFAGAIPGGAQAELARRYVPITLRELAESMGNLPQRRKALFLISTFTLDPESLEPNVVVNNGKAGLPLERRYEAQLIREFVASAQRANVNVYGINPYKLAAPEPQREDPLLAALEDRVPEVKLVDDPSRYTDDFLAAISYDTGGFPITGTNDVNGPLAQAFRENRSYYLLGYAPSNARAEGRFRRVTVRVNRPGVMVRAREGYFELHTDKKKRAVAPSSPLTSALAGVVKSQFACKSARASLSSCRRHAAASSLVGTAMAARSCCNCLTSRTVI
jgi:VWFA-related protein